MTRLTDTMRKSVTSAVLAHAMQADYNVITARSAGLARSLYLCLYDDATRALIDSLPDGFLPDSDGVTAMFGAERQRFNFSGNFYGGAVNPTVKRVEPVRRRVLYSHLDHNPAYLFLRQGDPLDVERQEINRLVSTYEEKSVTARASIFAAVNSVSTVQKLVKIWPEVEPFVAGYAPVEKTLPVIPVQDLNSLLGLPVTPAAEDA